jgi:hypothetical protein
MAFVLTPAFQIFIYGMNIEAQGAAYFQVGYAVLINEVVKCPLWDAEPPGKLVDVDETGLLHIILI